MKSTVFKTAIFVLCLLFSSTALTQDMALSKSIKPYANYYKFSSKVVIKNAVLDDGMYFYEYKKRKVNVEIKEGYYYEYMHNNQFLKAEIDWISEFTYKLKIISVETTQYPFKKGDTLVGKITRVEKNKFFYKSIFKGKEVKGSFEQIAVSKG